MSSVLLTPFQLLELNVISAQDLAQVSRKMRTYAVAWVHPNRKLSTRVDVNGHTNPTWNDKFVFRVDDRFLYGDTSSIMIEIYAVHWLRDIHVGSVRAIVGNLIPPARAHQHHHHQVQLGMRFVALQVRRRSGRPQGILNIGVALLDSSMRSMPLYSQLSASAVGFVQLMGGGGGIDPHHHNKDVDGDRNSENPSHFLHSQPPKPQIRRTKSDSSSMMASSMVVAAARRKETNNRKASSAIDGSEAEKKSNKQKGRSKASSTISGSDIVNQGIIFKPGSLVNGSDLVREPSIAEYGSEFMDAPPDRATTNAKRINGGLNNRSTYKDLKHGTLKKMNYPTIPLISESDSGPSASEVAAAMAKNKRYNNRTESDEMEGAWSLEMEGSIEGLQSKLDRWRAELPPVYDRSELSSYSDEREHPSGNKGAAGGHSRRHSTDGSGLFSCFGVICGVECSIVCGGSATRENVRRVKRRSRRRTAFE